MTFLAKKIKNHNFSVSTILDIKDSILDTGQYCEKARDLDFRSICDAIFSGLVKSYATFSKGRKSTVTKRTLSCAV